MLTAEHIVLLNALRKGPVGRVFLSGAFRMGEGKVRKILNELKEYGLIKSSKAGHYISKKGEDFLREIERDYLKITRRLSITVLNWTHAVEGIIRRRALRSPVSKDGMVERDLMVRNGALGAIVSVYRDGEARLPDTGIPLTKAIPGYSYDDVIRDMREGDLLVIVSGESFYMAMYALVKGALMMMGDVIL